jgi:hypothetical protein
MLVLQAWRMQESGYHEGFPHDSKEGPENQAMSGKITTINPQEGNV